MNCSYMKGILNFRVIKIAPKLRSRQIIIIYILPATIFLTSGVFRVGYKAAFSLSAINKSPLLKHIVCLAYCNLAYSQSCSQTSYGG
ncbi:hypothetical protein D3C78_1026230 [compost metagenome]